MLQYLTLGSNDIIRSRTFYDAALAPLGIARVHEDANELAYAAPAAAGLQQVKLWLVRPYLGYPATWGNGTMVAFAASSRQQVRDFHAAALAAGGTDDGAPGLRPYHPTFYSAYVRDPDGNKLSAVCEAAGE